LSYLINIGTAVPTHSLSQEAFCEIYSSMTEDTDIQRKIKFVTTRSAIEKRNCVEPDIKKLISLPLEKKLSIYHSNALKLAKKAIKNNPSYEEYKNQITDIILISCTGMQAPGLEIDLIQDLGLRSDIKRTNITFMGCYAALTGLRTAQDICKDSNRTVLLISVELCTLHFQNKHIDDYLLSNSIFADGAASAIISSKKKNAKVQLKNFESRLIPNSKKEMSWKISPNGFLMTLSSNVPKSIKASIDETPLFHRKPNTTHWAIHPGGKQIIDGLMSTLELKESDVSHSRNVLKKYGNMSSATILFVLNEMIKHRSQEKDDITACAFGPGLTLEAALMSYV